MSKKYYVWKNPECNGKNIEWCEISGKEFIELVSNPINAKRKFTRLGNDICDDADIIFMECTEIQYREWCHETRKHRYLVPYMRGRENVSLDYKYGIDEHALHDIVADDSVDVEADVTESYLVELLAQAIECLTGDERRQLAQLFPSDESEREIARKNGLPQKTLNNWNRTIIKKLKKYVAQNRI